MGVVITIRDVPDEVRDEVARRAARAGTPLQECLRAVFVDIATRSPVDDVIARVRARVNGTGVQVTADSILRIEQSARRSLTTDRVGSRCPCAGLVETMLMKAFSESSSMSRILCNTRSMIFVILRQPIRQSIHTNRLSIISG